MRHHSPRTGIGSGIIYDAAGFVLTNRHVVSTATQVRVELNDGRNVDGTVYGVDTLTDLAIVKIDANDVPAAPIGDSAVLEPGQTAIVIGSPLGTFTNSVTSGVVSALGRSLVVSDPGTGQQRRLRNLIQTDAAINPGNSGGPLLNGAGEVVGVSTAYAQGAQGIFFAIPINIAKPIMQQAVAGEPLTRPWIGIIYEAVDRNIADENELPIDYGAWIAPETGSGDPPIVAGSPAEKAGLQAGDIITSIDGHRIDAGAGLDDVLSLYKPGDTLTVEVLRNGQTVPISITLGTRPANLNVGTAALQTNASVVEHAIDWDSGLAHGDHDSFDALVPGQHIARQCLTERLEQVVAVVLDLRAADLEDVRIADRLRQVVAPAGRHAGRARTRCPSRSPADRRAPRRRRRGDPRTSSASRKIWSLTSRPSPPPAAAHDRVGHARGAHIWLDVMNADDVDSGGDAERCRGQRALDALVGRKVEDLANGRLAAGTQQHGSAERDQQIAGHAAAPDCARPSCRSRCPDRRSSAPTRCLRRARVEGTFEDRRAPRRLRSCSAPRRRLCISTMGSRRSAARRSRSSSAATPQMSLSRSAPASSGPGRHLGARRVDADRHVRQRGADRAHHRLDSRELLRSRYLDVAGPRRLAADVDQVGALGDHLHGLRDRALDTSTLTRPCPPAARRR